MSGRMKFGIFLAPFHPVDENPTLALERDLQLVQWLDTLGYDEAWIGEHHSAGYEIIASPEVFIATAAERTRHIRLGTGVSSLPYHHPLMLADRIMLLDHLTRGRVMFGVGPGSLPSDATMMGIEPAQQRDMMDEAISVLVPLLRGETVTCKTSWFELKNARLQLKPFSRDGIEIAVASMVSPAGARAAGKYGLALLSIGATTQGGFNALASNWKIAEEKAAEYGQTVDRNAWRLVGPMHVAETREKARDNVKFGLGKWLTYFTEVGALPLVPGGDPDKAVDSLIKTGMAVIGSPDDCIQQIERLQKESGGFGGMLQMAVNWADFEQTKKSYELIARYVFPHFQGTNTAREVSMESARQNRPELIGKVTGAIAAEIKKHYEEKKAAEKKAG